MSRLLKTNLMEDVFNSENESFMQETELMENEYSINMPTRFQYKGKVHNGWINVVNPFRASIVLGTPGSGKSYAIVNSYIKQQIQKGFSMYIYDYKYDDLSVIAYNTLLENIDKYEIPPKFYVINFDNPEHISQNLVQQLVDELRGVGTCVSTGGSAARTSRVLDNMVQNYYPDRIL